MSQSFTLHTEYGIDYEFAGDVPIIKQVTSHK
jgi:hypothetical protein